MMNKLWLNGLELTDLQDFAQCFIADFGADSHCPCCTNFVHCSISCESWHSHGSRQIDKLCL